MKHGLRIDTGSTPALRHFSPPVSPTSGPIGDVECVRRDVSRRQLDVHFDRIRAGDLEHIPAFISLILEGLSDTWSEIRGDTAKALSRGTGGLPIVVCQSLICTLMTILEGNDKNYTPTYPAWQVLHGALIGLYPFLHVAPPQQQSFIQNSCLALQRHSRLPVREAARECFGRLLSIIPDGLSVSTGLVILKISEILGSEQAGHPHNLAREAPRDAAHTYCLDGLLCCIGIIINSSTSLNDISVSGVGIVSLMCSCLGDASSTIRQIAGQNLLSLLRKVDESTVFMEIAVDCLECKRVIYQSIANQLEDRSVSKWPQHEASLLVGEEIIRSETLKKLEAGNLAPTGEPFLDILLFLLGKLFRATNFALMHSKFELRRVGAQLLPPLLRAIVLFSPDMLTGMIAAPGDVGISWEAFPGCSSLGNTSNIGEITDESTQVLQRNLFHCVVLTEIAKIFQHFSEVNHDDEALPRVIVASSSSSSSSVPPPGHRWVLEVQGRHMEDENRVAFHLALRKFCMKAPSNKDMLRSKSDLLITKLTEIMIHAQLEWSRVVVAAGAETMGEVTALYSCDRLEALALYCAVVDSNFRAVVTEEQPRRSCDFVRELFSDAWFVAKAARKTLETSDGDGGAATPIHAFSSLRSPVRILQSLMDPRGDSTQGTVACVAANRWICEAVAPVILVIVATKGQQPDTDVLTIALVVASWISKSVSDPLWLDRRPVVRRGLFDALTTLLRLLGGGDKCTSSGIIELADMSCDALSSCLSNARKWDQNELYQVLKLIHSAGTLIAMLRRFSDESTTTSATDAKLRISGLQSRLLAIRERLVASSSSQPAMHALKPRPAHEDVEDPSRQDSDDDQPHDLDEFSDWDVESDAGGELSMSESGLLTCDHLSIVKDIDDILL